MMDMMIRTVIRRWCNTAKKGVIVILASGVLFGAQPCRIQLMRPESIAVLPDGRVLVIDIRQRIIHQISLDGKATEFVKIPNKNKEKPVHLGFDGLRSYIVFSMSKDGELAIYSGDSVYLTRPGTGIRTQTNWFPFKGKYAFPSLRGLAYDSSSNLWGLTSLSMEYLIHPLTDKLNLPPAKLQNPLGSMPCELHAYAASLFLSLPYKEHCIWVIGRDGGVHRFAGQFGMAGETDGNRLEASFRFPEGLATRSDGTVFVSDTWNHVIRKIDPSGLVSIFAGKLGEGGMEDGEADKARFCLPSSMAIAPDGSLYILDKWFHAIRKIQPNGAVSTVATCTEQHSPWKKLPNLSTDFDRQIWLSVWWDRMETLRVSEACNLMLPAILGMTERRGRLHSFSTSPGWHDDLTRLSRSFKELFLGISLDPLDEAMKQIRDCLKSKGLVNTNGEPNADVVPENIRVSLALEITNILTAHFEDKSLHRTWANKYTKAFQKTP